MENKTELERIKHLLECRQQGVYDDPELMDWGFLDVDEEKDMREMIRNSFLSEEDKLQLKLEFRL